MIDFTLELLGLRLLVSVIGIMGNVFLIISILRTKFSRVKSFELFLLGLAASNLEELFIVDIYDIIALQVSSRFGSWMCRTLKFLTMFGETASILFTVVISIFRCQKLKDADRRVNLPIFLDSIRSAWMVSGGCVMFALLMSVPTYVMNMDGSVGNTTSNSTGCPPDFFQCHRDSCPFINRLYKYLFIMLCNLMPLLIVTATGCLNITVLLRQKRMVTPVLSVSGPGRSVKKSKDAKLQRSTLAVLVAMGLFQVDWTLYLVLHLAFSPDDFPSWSEIEFFISTTYTSSSPYVFGIGNSLFSLKNIMKK